jgi:hypothetical protein
MTEPEEGETTWETPQYSLGDSLSAKLMRVEDAFEDKRRFISPDDSIRDTKPILEDSIRDDLKSMSDEELRSVWNWSNSWTTDHVSAVKRWVARGPISDEIKRRTRLILSAFSDGFSGALPESTGKSESDP